jgi:methylenetetrahydrofolate dehydrogenase (NADP+)/methenyltetrahydrofolate cyclohydrolase
LGDVDFTTVSKIVKAISPVPGGVGPMTVVSLFENLLLSYKRQNKLY